MSERPPLPPRPVCIVPGCDNLRVHATLTNWCSDHIDNPPHRLAREARPTAAARQPTVDVEALVECECVPGHRCDCEDLRSLLWRILTSAEYGKMEAEGLAADALGLRWSEGEDRYVSPTALAESQP